MIGLSYEARIKRTRGGTDYWEKVVSPRFERVSSAIDWLHFQVRQVEKDGAHFRYAMVESMDTAPTAFSQED